MAARSSAVEKEGETLACQRASEQWRHDHGPDGSGSSNHSRIWLAKAPLTVQQDLSPLFRLGRTLQDIPTQGNTQQQHPLPPLPQAAILAPPPAADTWGLVAAMRWGGGGC